jgi:PAS domain S-box-containing protein
MLRARGSDAAEYVFKIKRPRSSFPQLALVLVSALAFMTLFEVTKSLVFPALTLWGSHLITIAVSSILATTAASFVLRKLRHGEYTYDRLVGMSPDAVWVHRQGTIIDANTACAKMFGVSSPAELLGKHVLDFVHADDRDAVRVRIQNHLDDCNLVRHYETKSVRVDGGEFDVELLVFSILHQGEAASLVMFHDISERKRAEHRLRESEANLAGAQRIAHMGSWELALTNLDGGIAAEFPSCRSSRRQGSRE